MRIGFAGSPAFAVHILNTMVEAQFNVVRILTQAPKPSGRGRKLLRCPVHQRAEDLGIECHTPRRIRIERHLVSDLDVLVVAAYGVLLPETIFGAPTHGALNVHASLLPRWRGASPIEHAILAGDRVTGISIMQIEKGLDTGPVFSQRTLPIGRNDTTNTLTEKLAVLGSSMIVEVIEQLDEGSLKPPISQSNIGVQHSPRLQPADAKVDWRNDANYILRQVHAFDGRTPAWATFGDVRIRILAAQEIDGEFQPSKIYRTKSDVIVGCGKNGLRLQTVQINRGKGLALPIKVALNGFSEIFSEEANWDLS